MDKTVKSRLRRAVNSKHFLLVICISISILILSILLFSQDNDVKMLGLEVKWLIVSAVPIFLALLIGGYIRTFKGFGLDFELALMGKIPMTVVSNVAPVEVPSTEKLSVNRIRLMPELDRAKIRRLQFYLGKLEYYDQNDFDAYLRELKNLKYIEIINRERELLYLLSVNKIESMSSDPHPDYIVDPDLVTQLICAIERKDFTLFSGILVSESLRESDSLLKAYRKLTTSSQASRLEPGQRVLPVVNSTGHMIGVVELPKVTAKIAEEVDRVVDP